MEEALNICLHSWRKSLVLIDELGINYNIGRRGCGTINIIILILCL